MTNETEAPDLLPCPFCGGKAYHTSRSNGENYSGWQNAVDHWIFCDTENCYVHVGMCETRGEAIDAWNTRADLSDAQAARIAELEAECWRMKEERDRAIGWRDGDQARAEAAEAKLAKAETLLVEYRTKTPLGHQPHMIAHRVDDFIAELKGGE